MCLCCILNTAKEIKTWSLFKIIITITMPFPLLEEKQKRSAVHRKPVTSADRQGQAPKLSGRSNGARHSSPAQRFPPQAAGDYKVAPDTPVTSWHSPLCRPLPSPLPTARRQAVFRATASLTPASLPLEPRAARLRASGR